MGIEVLCPGMPQKERKKRAKISHPDAGKEG